jgi:putative pyruvate formate lyase activating enzyme
MLCEKSILQAYSNCRLCPRYCGVNRNAGEMGYCRETSQLRISSASLHWGEEPPVTGRGGSGTVFITGCNLGCLFCQNWDISLAGRGRAVSKNELVNTFLNLQKAGAENINLVTPTHAAPFLIDGLNAAREKGLTIPALWNSSAYESNETLSILDSIDIWLPDLKTLDSSVSAKYFNAPDYPETAANAILNMLERSKLSFNRRGTVISGVIIRHLALPGHLDASYNVLKWFAENAQGRNGSKALLSLLTQYTPIHRTGSKNIPGRRISLNESDTLQKWLKEFQIEDGYFQGRSIKSL